MTKRKVISLIAGATLLGALFYVGVWPFAVGGRQMETLCRSLAKDILLSQVRDRVQQNGYRMTPPDQAGHAYIHDPRSFGRFVCEVQFKEEHLASARYQLND